MKHTAELQENPQSGELDRYSLGINYIDAKTEDNY